MIDYQTLNLAAATISKFTDKKYFSGYVVNVCGEYFGFHSVGLFLIDEPKQNAVLTAGYGKFAESLLAHSHKLPLNNKGLVVDVIGSGEIRVQKPIHSKPFYWGHELYRCSLPNQLQQIDTPLIFQLFQAAELIDWLSQSIIAPPIGWEICLPMRLNGIIFGAIDILIQLELNTNEKQHWANYLLTESDEVVQFSLDDCANLQWLTDHISSQFTKQRPFEKPKPG